MTEPCSCLRASSTVSDGFICRRFQVAASSISFVSSSFASLDLDRRPLSVLIALGLGLRPALDRRFADLVRAFICPRRLVDDGGAGSVLAHLPARLFCHGNKYIW